MPDLPRKNYNHKYYLKTILGTRKKRRDKIIEKIKSQMSKDFNSWNN
jgi:hypothetical protein